jgi:hypothetical protein
MSYAPIRFLYENYLTDPDMITPGSQAPGIVGGVENISGDGLARMVAMGAFTGAEDLLYTIVIDGVTGGTQIGQATFAWKTSATVSGWEATGVTTSAEAIPLNYGVSVYFSSAGGVDFAVGDLKRFQATALYAPGNLIDYDRNRYFRTGATFSLVIDLGGAKQVRAFAIMGHNLLEASSTLTLEYSANGSSWGTPISVTVKPERLSLYLDKDYQYWRVTAADGSLTYIEFGELFLGDYLELETDHADWGMPRTHKLFTVGDALASGVQRRQAVTSQKKVSLDFADLEAADLTLLLAMYAALYESSTGRIFPLFVHLFYDEPETLYYMDWVNLVDFQEVFARYQGYKIKMELAEQVQTRV